MSEYLLWAILIVLTAPAALWIGVVLVAAIAEMGKEKRP